jgi:hypothetical protein
MVSDPPTVNELLDRADAERRAGRGAAAARLYDEAIDRCREDIDLAGWTRAVLGAASVYLFGVEPGRLPAQLYDLLARTTDDADRARLEAALARCWAYAGEPRRAARFADDAVRHAETSDAPELVADCLDAALAAHWGPDELDIRRSLAGRLDEVAAHVLDPDTRLQAHLWALQVACESLDLPGIHRQMRALERLGEESERALFFAASRRLMLDLLRGRTDTATELTRVAERAATGAGLADAWMVVLAMAAYTAAQCGDRESCTAAAEKAEAFALTEGITTLAAEAAYLWACAGRPDRVQALLHQFRGRAIDALPRDVNWLLTVQCLLEAALFVADGDVVEQCALLLTPYENRAVMNAGAVMFHGLTDDTLARAHSLLGDGASATRLRSRAVATYDRIGAQWWRDRLTRWDWAASPAPGHGPRCVHLHPTAGGLWSVGPAGSAVTVRPLRGFDYLRQLVRRPHQPLLALDLVGGGTGSVTQSGLGELVDRQALTAYRQRLREIDQELAEAEDWSDIDRVTAVRTERDALLDEVARATGLHGRSRTTGSSQERARVAVQKAISAAIDRIDTVDESVAQHLRSSIRTGLACSYEPHDTDIVDWIADPG